MCCFAFYRLGLKSRSFQLVSLVARCKPGTWTRISLAPLCKYARISHSAAPATFWEMRSHGPRQTDSQTKANRRYKSAEVDFENYSARRPSLNCFLRAALAFAISRPLVYWRERIRVEMDVYLELSATMTQIFSQDALRVLGAGNRFRGGRMQTLGTNWYTQWRSDLVHISSYDQVTRWLYGVTVSNCAC